MAVWTRSRIERRTWSGGGSGTGFGGGPRRSRGRLGERVWVVCALAVLVVIAIVGLYRLAMMAAR